MILCSGELGRSSDSDNSLSPVPPSSVVNRLLTTNAASRSASICRAAVPNGSTAAATPDKNSYTLLAVDDASYRFPSSSPPTPPPIRMTSSIVTGGRLTAKHPVSIRKNTAFTICISVALAVACVTSDLLVRNTLYADRTHSSSAVECTCSVLAVIIVNNARRRRKSTASSPVSEQAHTSSTACACGGCAANCKHVCCCDDADEADDADPALIVESTSDEKNDDDDDDPDDFFWLIANTSPRINEKLTSFCRQSRLASTTLATLVSIASCNTSISSLAAPSANAPGSCNADEES